MTVPQTDPVDDENRMTEKVEKKTSQSTRTFNKKTSCVVADEPRKGRGVATEGKKGDISNDGRTESPKMGESKVVVLKKEPLRWEKGNKRARKPPARTKKSIDSKIVIARGFQIPLFARAPRLLRNLESKGTH